VVKLEVVVIYSERMTSWRLEQGGRMTSWRFLLLFLGLLVLPCCQGDGQPFSQSGSDTEPRLLKDPGLDCAVTPQSGTAVDKGEETMILASLLDGSLVALGKGTGAVRWRLADEPVVKSPYDPLKPVLPAFLPDPKDGALYMMGGSLEDPLQKLPFTIPQLVAASPSRTSDGILYSGRKVDTWVSVSRHTGTKKGSLSFDGCLRGVKESDREGEDMCPAMEPGTVLLGRTEYNIMMYDTRTKNRKWNITYYDYSSSLGGIDMSKDYDLAHFTDSSTGKLFTLDKVTGHVEWEVELRSPVVAMYQLAGESIASIPFTSVSQETLNNLMDQFQSSERRRAMGDTKLFPTLYVGEHEHGLFAVPSLVDEKTMMISPSRERGQLLLEGNTLLPEDIGMQPGKQAHPFKQEPIPKDKSSVLLFGYYQVPDYSGISIHAPNQIQLTTSQAMFPFEVDHIQMIEGPEVRNTSETEESRPQLPYDEEELSRGLESIVQLNSSFLLSSELPVFLMNQLVPMMMYSLPEVENKELKVVVLAVLLTVAWFVRFVKLHFKQWDKNFGERLSNSNSNSASRGSTSSISPAEVTANPVELEDGSIKVGNISFNPGLVLGKGCEGTFVYKGKFDGRDVAVKRVLAACFSIADREVDLLRESDEHPHVVRYFCMEQCRQFRYIALELCVATLQDWVEGRFNPPSSMDVTNIFKQAVLGIAHLHGLDIAHRDIKPQNVLLSCPGRSGAVRAMISDFGLCKKLKVGRMSFSRRSGVAGTEGWIAPEMLLGNRSTTCMVDIFSMGCVYYYLLTWGKHPFGQNFHRQANILSGQKDVDLLNSDRQHTQISLINKMISPEPNDRPPTSALLKHPVFWNKEKVLGFLQEVSDRVDQEEDGSVVLASLEKYGGQVTGGDWHRRLDPLVLDDLMAHRSYRGKSVRDLLRAIRNKKHHYWGISEGARALYGDMPNGFAEYWESRFPKLLMHSYQAMQCCKLEKNFEKYYHKDFDFVPTVVRRQGDISPQDMDLVSPPYLLGKEEQDQGARERSRLSVVSNWSQLDSSDYRTEILLPCSRDPSSEEGSDGKGETSEEEALVGMETETQSQAQEIENSVINVMRDTVVTDVSDRVGLVSDILDSTETFHKKEQLHEMKSESAQAEEENGSERTFDGENCDEILKAVVSEKNNIVLKSDNPFIEENQENVIPKKKNKKRRKHAKKKKPGDPEKVDEVDEAES